MYKIMIVEDDRTIAGVLCDTLQKWGFETYAVEDFTSITKQFIDESPHLVLLDISLPCRNGYYWCAELRKLSRTPVIFISSNTGNMDIVMAINMGGDDFITKPFDLNVAVAKIQALLRRSYSWKDNMDLVEHGGVILDRREAAFFYQGRRVDLTKNEFEILRLLFDRIGTVVSREDMMKKLWNDDCFIDDNTLTVNVARLRRKLEEQGLMDFIETKKGMGYRIAGEKTGGSDPCAP